MEVSLTNEIEDDYCKIIDSLIIGRSENTEPDLDSKDPHGIITPRSENFSIEGAKFYNFLDDDGEQWGAALGDCSHCFFAASTDSGARTVTVSGLEFDSQDMKRIRYQFPFRGIWYDADGSLTDLGYGSWATANWTHNYQPECVVSELYDGVICDSSVQVRRVAFHAYQPSSFYLSELRIAKFDVDLEEELTNNNTR